MVKTKEAPSKTVDDLIEERGEKMKARAIAVLKGIEELKARPRTRDAWSEIKRLERKIAVVERLAAGLSAGIDGKGLETISWEVSNGGPAMRI